MKRLIITLMLRDSGFSQVFMEHIHSLSTVEGKARLCPLHFEIF